VKSSHGLDVQLTCDAGAEPADAATRLLLFKAVRELLMNVAKHAGANNVTLVMERCPGPRVQITVADQGAGFDAASRGGDQRRRGGSGLWNIERRLGMIGGRIDIESEPGAGTTARLSAPLETVPPAPAAPQPAPGADRHGFLDRRGAHSARGRGKGEAR
jgi:signal transduction histidine kinase